MDLGQNIIEEHYANQAIDVDALNELIELDRGFDQIKPEDLAAIDEFHVGGRKATRNFAQKLSLESGMQVLDVGSGLGGASRYLAQEFGCHVTGLDLSVKYCEIAAGITRQVGLDSHVCYRHGNAVNMPFDDAIFDLIWTQHVTMNVSDKVALYSEMWRVLKPGGILASYEILAGAGGPVHFPVPWARNSSTSFLQTPQSLQELLQEIKFEIISWQDKTEFGHLWFRNSKEKVRKRHSTTFGLHLLLGSEFPLMAKNQIQNLSENRILLVELIARRPLATNGC